MMIAQYCSPKQILLVLKLWRVSRKFYKVVRQTIPKQLATRVLKRGYLKKLLVIMNDSEEYKLSEELPTVKAIQKQ